MSNHSQELDKFLKALAENTDMQESLTASVKKVSTETELNSLLTEQAYNAGYNITAEDAELLIQLGMEKAENTELTDETLDQVSGGIKIKRFGSTTGRLINNIIKLFT